jgi:acetyl-CoA C-acetyltransferase
MSKVYRTAVIGVGQTDYRRHRTDATPDLVFEAVSRALSDARLSMRDVDMVISGYAPDGLAGENSPDKRFAPAAGATGRASFRVNTGGTTGIAAAHAALDMLEAGECDVVLVVGVERMSQARDVAAVFNSIFDPIYERDVGISTISMNALRASRQMVLYGYTPEIWARVAVRNFAHGLDNPLAQIRRDVTVDDVLSSPLLSWPVRLLDACPISEGACAIVFAREVFVDRISAHEPAWIEGRASCSDTYGMGDRIGRSEGDLVDLLTLKLAADKAFSDAGVTSGAQAQVLELHAPFTAAETMTYSPLRLCLPRDGPELVLGGFGQRGTSTVINPSGGPQTANPVGATALIRLAECALQVRGRAEDRQVPGTRLAVATGQGGASQFSACTVLVA